MSKSTTVLHRLLTRLRRLLAESETIADPLASVVSLIADDLDVQVCSCYVMRTGEVLELFATQGLKKEAVHITRLRIGEGLVGTVAAQLRPIAASDAFAHPSFAYRPETGEDNFHSFLGVPIIRNNRLIGVLVVQTKNRRDFSADEIESLETVAMLLAEMISRDDALRRESKHVADGQHQGQSRAEGMRLAGGIGMGTARWHTRHIQIREFVADDPAQESERLQKALDEMHREIDNLLSSHKPEGEGEHLDILETYRMFATDRGWIKRISAHIESGLTAEAAAKKALDDTWTRMSQITDPYIRERFHDLQDLTDRLLSHLSSGTERASDAPLEDDVILIAKTLGPADLLEYDRTKIKGVILEEGSPTLHVAIIARALGIPMLAQIKTLSTIDTGDTVIVDGDHGIAYIRPPEDIIDETTDQIRVRAERQLSTIALRDEPVITKDGVRIKLQLNAGLVSDVDYLDLSGADGIGLYRTEIPFMTQNSMPDVQTQARLYSDILDRTKDKPVIFRMLDIGADKMLPYWKNAGEDNPALGWRSIRITLDRRSVMRTQFRALLRGANGRPLSVMFPMIAEVAEFIAAKETLALEMERERKKGNPLPASLRIGTMIEVPSLVLQLPALLPLADFVSVGSNDLTQFLFASDRGNPRLAGRYDELSPATLNILHMIASACKEHGVACSLCGEMAGSPLKAMSLIGLGYRSLSVTGANFGAVKMMISTLDTREISPYVTGLLNSPVHTLREKLRAFAVDHHISLS